MNAKITYNTEMLAGVCWEDQLLMNSYQLEIDLITNTADPVDQNIALLRMRHVLEDQLQDSYFIEHTEQATISRLTDANIKLSILPEMPVDQVIGMILFTKLSAVTEEKVLIQSLRIKSKLGDDIVYHHSENDASLLDQTSGWWSHAGPECNSELIENDTATKLRTINVLKKWRDLNMQWNDSHGKSDSGNVLVFNEHKKDS